LLEIERVDSQIGMKTRDVLTEMAIIVVGVAEGEHDADDVPDRAGAASLPSRSSDLCENFSRIKIAVKAGLKEVRDEKIGSEHPPSR
jgi:hypothetical protein